MHSFPKIVENLKKQPKTWLITGAAGFIGSNLLEYLLLLNQRVIGIDNFFSGKPENLESINITDKAHNFKFYNVDITDYNVCKKALFDTKIDFILHHAAIASVPLSIVDPKLTTKVNIDGFVNILEIAKDCQVKALIYASSSAVYGDNTDALKMESKIGNFLSPYALSKYTNELYAEQYAKHYGLCTVGLRYFNIYGPRQNPNSTYSAVIPKWISQILNKQQLHVNGDGTTTRDFCYIANVIKANILACFNSTCSCQVYNIGVGESIQLADLLNHLLDISRKKNNHYDIKPIYKDFIAGDIKHSCASISLARNKINYEPTNDIISGLESVYNWLQLQNAVTDKRYD